MSTIIKYYADAIHNADGSEAFDLPNTGGSSRFVSRTSTDTLSNKTLNSPTLVTPDLGAATAASINKLIISPPINSATLSVFDGVTAQFLANFTVNNPITLNAGATVNATFATGGNVQIVDADSTQTLTNKTLTSPSLTSPTMTTPSLGVATATSINKVTITQPTTSATLTLTDGTTLYADADFTVTGVGPLTLQTPNDPVVATIPATGNITLVDTTTAQSLSAKTLVQPLIVDNTDTTKKIDFDVSGVTAGQTRTIKPLDVDYEITYNPYYGGAYHGSFTAANGANPISEAGNLIDNNGIMQRDIHADVLTIPSGYNLNTGGYRIFARKLVFTDTTSIIRRNGNNATSSTGATALAAGTCGQGMPGGNGGGPNVAGSAATNSAGGIVTGMGGAGGAGAQAGGGAGTLTAIAASAGGTGAAAQNWRILFNTHLAWKCRDQANTVLTGGRGGGGGGGGSTGGGASGGGGGGGGGIIVIFAHTIEIASGANSIKHIQVNGGNGFNGGVTTVGTNAGGGGGGNGGMIFIGYNQLINFNLITNTSATPGTGGAAGTGGTGGSAGVTPGQVSPWLVSAKI